MKICHLCNEPLAKGEGRKVGSESTLNQKTVYWEHNDLVKCRKIRLEKGWEDLPLVYGFPELYHPMVNTNTDHPKS